ncbi:AGC/AKT protein kinase [Aphelenchoides fujianensis]|nr:AGC/AKT protein kinase [Aphelenchoides fujianensis]
MSGTPRRKTSLLDWTRLNSSGFASFAASLSGNQPASLSNSNPSLNNAGKEPPPAVAQPPTTLASSGSVSSSNSSGTGRNTSTSSSGQPLVCQPSVQAPHREVVIEGCLLKRGEHLKTWRSRYFVLYEDGGLCGWKSKADKGGPPLNDFTVKDVQLLKVERPRANTFLMRGLQWSTVIERTFCAESADVREQWIAAIHRVAETLKPIRPPIDSAIPPSPKTSVDHTRKISNAMAARAQSREPREVTIEDFDFLKVLGKGTFGKVILCREHRTGKLYAMKLLKKEVIVQKDEVTHTYTENRVLQKCKHPFLTQMAYTFQTSDRLCFVMQYASGGDLYTQLNTEVQTKRTGFSESRTRFYGAEITMALGYLHENNIIYRDLKASITSCASRPPCRPRRVRWSPVLLIKDPNARLGGGIDDWQEIKIQSFFAPIDWELLYRKKIPPPFKPKLNTECDTSYFDAEFTSEPVQLTPPPVRSGELEIVEENEDEIEKHFVHFSFHNTIPPAVRELSEVPP